MALHLNPRHAAARVALGTTLYLAGDHAGARAQWQAALTLGDPQQASEAAGLLREYRDN